MSKIQSHENCAHESTKAARAKCRRSRQKFADAFTAALATPATIIEQPEPVFEAVTMTADNWREHKDERVRIFTRVSDDEQSEIATGVKITGWGKRWINYATADGQTKRAAADSTTGVETIEG